MGTFILVHGTFAKSAHWPFLQDRLAETARAAGDEPLFEQLPWTGRNRARARQAAASAIFALVQKIQRTSANQKIFLIGHSHGGSAIAYFLKQHPEAAKTLAGCAFLSTPFVAIRPRRETVRLISVLLFFPYIAFLSLWNGITSPFPPEEVLETYNELAPAYLQGYLLGYLPVIGVAVAVVWAFLVFVKKRASDPKFAHPTEESSLRWRSKVEQSIRQQTADLPAGNYLFLRCSGDEAAAALSATQFIAWLGIKASTILELLTRSLFNAERPFARAISWVVLAFFLLPTIAYGWLGVLPGVWRSGFGYLLSPDVLENSFVRLMVKISPLIALVPIVYTLVAFVVVCVLFLCLFAVFLIVSTQAVTSWAFGWTRLSTGFLVELAIEPLPFGAHSLVHIDWAAGSTGLDGIVHSWTYAHPVALMHLQNWVRASLGKLPITAVETTTVAPTDQRTN
jgi:alpha-beta hydrolase superfamily lysophospholipase